MAQSVSLSLTSLRKEQIAHALGRKGADDKFDQYLQKGIDDLAAVYARGEFYVDWRPKRVAIATALFRSALRSDGVKPSKRILHEIMTNANDYERVMKPLLKQILAFIKRSTEYSKVRHEIKIYSDLSAAERRARTMYLAFLLLVIENIKTIGKYESVANKFSTDENGKYFFDLAVKICDQVDAKSTPKATRIWLLKNVKFLSNLWDTDFKNYKD